MCGGIISAAAEHIRSVGMAMTRYHVCVMCYELDQVKGQCNCVTAAHLAGAFELQLPPLAIMQHLTDGDGAAIPQLPSPVAKLMAAIALQACCWLAFSRD